MKFEKTIKIIDFISFCLFIVATGFVVVFKFEPKIFLITSAVLCYIFAFLTLAIFNFLKLLKFFKNEKFVKKEVFLLVVKLIFCLLALGFSIYILFKL